jgi:hypothetical protein
MIETELADSARALAGLPALGAADPQAVGAAALVRWITAGRVVLSAYDVKMIRSALLDCCSSSLLRCVNQCGHSAVRAAFSNHADKFNSHLPPPGTFYARPFFSVGNCGVFFPRRRV